MNEGIFVHCCTCCFDDGVMITSIPPFCFADSEDVSPYSIYWQEKLLSFMFCISRCPFLEPINIQPCSSCAVSVCINISADGLGKAMGGFSDELSCVTLCTLTHGNPPYRVHRGKGLCASTLCMPLIPTLDVCLEGKSVNVCICVSITGHGLCNERC